MEALFSIGQKVVCVDSTDPNPTPFAQSPPLIEGKTYTNYENHVCSCGNVRIDVGLTGDVNICVCKCGKEEYTGSKWFVNQLRFVPLDDDRAMDEQIRESLNQHLIERI